MDKAMLKMMQEIEVLARVHPGFLKIIQGLFRVYFLKIQSYVSPCKAVKDVADGLYQLALSQSCRDNRELEFTFAHNFECEYKQLLTAVQYNLRLKEFAFPGLSV